jgi:hypothetical protein
MRHPPSRMLARERAGEAIGLSNWSDALEHTSYNLNRSNVPKPVLFCLADIFGPVIRPGDGSPDVEKLRARFKEAILQASLNHSPPVNCGG